MEHMPDWCGSMISSLSSPQEERCGYVLDDWTLVLVRNLAENPEREFQFDPDQQFRIVKAMRPRIIGMFHTHPSGSYRPSQKDKESWPPMEGFRYWIGTSKEVAEWEMHDGQTEIVGFVGAHAERELVSEICSVAGLVRRQD